MLRCFPAMNVQKRSFSRESDRIVYDSDKYETTTGSCGIQKDAECGWGRCCSAMNIQTAG